MRSFDEIQRMVADLPNVVDLLAAQRAARRIAKIHRHHPSGSFDTLRDAANEYELDPFKDLHRHIRPATDYCSANLQGLPDGVAVKVTSCTDHGLFLDLRGGAFGDAGFTVNARSDQAQRTLEILLAGNAVLAANPITS